jgi:drug/metabolite transporter (DMT)-like permease
MPFSRTRVGIVAAFAAIYLIWGSTYLALALALKSLPPFLLMAMRCLVGGAILCGFATLKGCKAPPRRIALLAIGCGLLFFLGCHGVLAEAQRTVPSGLAAVLLATVPLWIALLQWVLQLSGRPAASAVAFLIPGVAGVGLIAWRQASSGESELQPTDLLLLLGASLSWDVGTLISERQTHRYPPLALSGLELLAGGLALLVVSLIRGEWRDFSLTEVTPTSLASWVYLTIAGTLGAFAAYIWLLKRVTPTLVATYTFVNPVIAVALGWAFLHERLTIWMAAGAVLIVISVGGLLLIQSRTSSEKGGQRLTGRLSSNGGAGLTTSSQ